jgi:membrane dipeptidase
MDEEDEGLTPYGEAVIAEMNRVGMILCLSHTGERTATEAIELSSKPPIFSHSNSAAVHPHRRNISDRLIKMCADRGGVVGINGLGDFLCAPGEPIVPALVRHIDHAVQLVGPDHVGIALDYVYDQDELRAYLKSMPNLFPGGIPEEFPFVPPEDLPLIADGLLRLGYTDRDLSLILGRSWLRVARENWDGAAAGPLT